MINGLDISRMRYRRRRTTLTFIVLLISVGLFFYIHVTHVTDDPLGPGGQDMTSGVDLDWKLQREILLSDKNRTAKVLLFTYMRGGSTVFSQLFNIQPNTSVRWYEPLDSFYLSYYGLQVYSVPLRILYYDNFTRRMTSEQEQKALTDFLDNILSCDLDRLPLQAISHSDFLRRTGAFQSVNHCLPRPQSALSMEVCASRLRYSCAGTSDRNRPNLQVSLKNKCHDILTAISNSSSTEWSKPGVVRKSRMPSVEELSSVAGRKLSKVEYSRFSSHNSCMERIRGVVNSCWLPGAKLACARAKLVSAKVVRATMDGLEGLIRRVPDLSIVYFVRDPRAIASSRVVRSTSMMYRADDTSPVTETKGLCPRMMDDLRAKAFLDKRYPGVILTIRYEDFVADTRRMINRVFEHIGRPPPSNVEAFIARTVRSGRSRRVGGHGGQGAVRSPNVSGVVNKWRRKVSANDTVVMNRNCAGVLTEFRYEP